MEKSRVMFVDDEAFVLNSLKRSLKREGYEIVTFTEAEQALEYLKQNAVSVVVSDQRMPSVTGLELLIKVRQLYPNVIRILLTGYTDMDVAIRAINEGKLYRFLTKPWNDEELRVTLRNAIELHELLERNRLMLQTIKEQDDQIRQLEKIHPGISQVNRDQSGAIVIDEF